MTLGIKYIESIFLSYSQAECVEIYRGTLSTMHSTKINHKVVVDKDPCIIIPCEIKCLARHIFESSV